MANDDLNYKDSTATPVPFTPHGKDKGVSTTTGLKVIQPQVGLDDNEFVTFGSTQDVPAGGDTWTSTGLSYMRAFKGFWRDIYGLLNSLVTAATSSNPVTTTVTGSLPAGSNALGSVTLGAGTAVIGSVALSGVLPAFATAPAVTVSANPGAKKQTGSLSAVNDTVVLTVDGYNTGALQFAALTGTPTGAAIIEATQDGGTSWFAINMAPIGAGTAPTATSTLTPSTSAQNLEAAIGSYDQIRVRCTTVFSAPQPVVLGAYTGGKSTRAGLLPGTNAIGKVGIQVAGSDVAGGNPVPVSSAPAASELHLGEVGGHGVVTPPVSFTRPANTTAYAIGQLSANSTTAGSVVPLSFSIARKNGGTGRITRLRFSSSNVAAVNNVYRLHLYKTSPTTTVGDGGAISGATNILGATWLGAIDVTMSLVGSDGVKGIGVPNTGPFMTFDTASGAQTLFGLVEARSAYTPASGEVYTAALEGDLD